MKDQPSNSVHDDDEPVRFTMPKPNIEEYLEWSEEAGGYISPDVPSKWDKQYWAALWVRAAATDGKRGKIQSWHITPGPGFSGAAL